MEGTPAGWYDDPEQPGQQRYWDGAAWTEQRAPGAAAAAAATTPTPGTPAAKRTKKALWVVLAVIGGFVLVMAAAIAALALLGDRSTTDVVEENLPAALEVNYQANGADVTVTKADCDAVPTSDGLFTTNCTITIEGLDQPIEGIAYGTIEGSTLSVEDFESPDKILTPALAVEQAQQVIDVDDPTVRILACTLPAPVVLVQDGFTFTCTTDTNQTVTFGVQNGLMSVTDVS